MDVKVGQDAAQKLKDQAKHRTRYSIIWTGLGIVAFYCALFSFTHPGGVLYRARDSLRPYTSRLDGQEYPHNISFDTQHICSLHDPNEDPLPAKRSSFGSRGTFVFGWPSKGGVWVHSNCYGLELEFLGISRFEPSQTERFSDEEDDFCKRLEMIGAIFYDSEYAYNERVMVDRPVPLAFYGWPGAVPAGGVWALLTDSWEGAHLGIARIRNALTMEERCKAIEMLGGRYSDKWEDAPRAAPIKRKHRA